MFDSSVIELSKAALRRNLGFLQKEIGPEVKISSVIKGNAYGHGIDTFVPLAESCGVRHFSVFDADEAYRVRKCQSRCDTDVMIMGYVTSDGLGWAIEHDVSFYVFNVSRMDRALALAKKIGKPARVHLELETGMNRTGLSGADLKHTVEKIVNNPAHTSLESVCTHFAGAETVANYKRVQDQILRFDDLCRQISAMRLKIPMRHSESKRCSPLLLRKCVLCEWGRSLHWQ